MGLILDQTFGIGGIVAIPFGPWNVSWGVALQKKQRIVVAGYAGGLLQPADFVVARYKPNGTLDATFGPGGSVDTDFNNNDDIGNAVVVQTDDKIVVGGRSSRGSQRWNFALARYDAQGKLDPTFGVNGLVTTLFGDPFDYSEVRGLAVQKDGRIVAAGLHYSIAEKKYRFALARYDKKGKLDPSFGMNGQTLTELIPGGDSQAFGVAIQQNGRIIAVGEGLVGKHYYIVIAGYRQVDGKLDPAFGAGGRVVTHLGSGASGRAIAITANDRFTIAGWVDTASLQRMVVVRYNPNGKPIGAGMSAPQWAFGQAHAVAVLNSGDVIAAGQMFPPGSTWVYHFAVTGFRPDGKLDLTAGNNGTLITPIGLYSAIHSIAVQPDQKIVAAGFSDLGAAIVFALARYKLAV